MLLRPRRLLERKAGIETRIRAALIIPDLTKSVIVKSAIELRERIHDWMAKMVQSRDELLVDGFARVAGQISSTNVGGP